MKSKVIIGIVVAAVLGGGYTVSRMDFIGTGKVGIVYNYKDGVKPRQKHRQRLIKNLVHPSRTS